MSTNWKRMIKQWSEKNIVHIRGGGVGEGFLVSWTKSIKKRTIITKIYLSPVRISNTFECTHICQLKYWNIDFLIQWKHKKILNAKINYCHVFFYRIKHWSECTKNIISEKMYVNKCHLFIKWSIEFTHLHYSTLEYSTVQSSTRGQTDNT